MARLVGAGKIAVGGEIAGLVIAGQLHPVDLPLRIIEGEIDRRLAELALVDQVPDYLVEAVEADGQSGDYLLGDAGIEVVRPFRQNG